MCHTCNSSYKTTKDPISREPGKRQKAFAPFEPAVPFPTMTVHFEATRIQALKPQHITLKIESVTHAEEFETWEWLFGIQQRYKGKLCKKRGAYTWLNTVLTDSRNYKVTPQEVLEKIRANTAGDPFLDDGFLKLPTLDACQSAGLL